MLRSCTILLFISYALALDCPPDWTDAGMIMLKNSTGPSIVQEK